MATRLQATEHRLADLPGQHERDLARVLEEALASANSKVLGSSLTPGGRSNDLQRKQAGAPPGRAMKVLSPEAAWRAGLRLRGQRVCIQGQGRVFTTIDDTLVVRFHKGRQCLLTCAITSGGGGPLEGTKGDSEDRFITVEAQVRAADEGGLVMLDQGEILGSE